MTGTITPDLLLDRAADLLDEKGWCQGRAHDRKGRSCALGALMVLREELGVPGTYRTARNLADAEALRLGGNGGVVYFNDYVAKDKRYVTRLLRRAARRFRGAAR